MARVFQLDEGYLLDYERNLREEELMSDNWESAEYANLEKFEQMHDDGGSALDYPENW